jgi:signal transduction histidine kinase
MAFAADQQPPVPRPSPVAGSNPGGRVLMLLPTVRDGQITSSILTNAGMVPVLCTSMPELASQIQVGAAAVLLTEEAIISNQFQQVLDVLNTQPAWSDLPIILMIGGRSPSANAARVLQSLRNVTLLERPAPTRSVVSAVMAAVRARLRQYQIRDQLDTVQKAEIQLASALEAERAARTEAERVGRMKDEFLATLSHELRTPLNAILGWSHLLRQSAVEPDELAEGLEIIERNARAQTQLIEDLLDMSRIISGKVRVHLQLIDPMKMVEAAISTVRPAALSKGVNLTLNNDAGACTIWVDPNRLQQIVWNLLSNAIKFTPPGGSVSVSVHDGNSQFTVKVSDSGRGIDADFLPHVFERFRQADSKTTREKGGLGLGLAIVKSLVELHGGTISAESPGRGRGATFTFSLPVGVSPAETPRQNDVTPRAAPREPAVSGNTDLSGMKVLVVDDEPDARELSRRILTQCGAEVVTAASAPEAIRLLESESPDVLISDIGMPVTDGYDLLKTIRSLGPAHRGDIPAIALTAFARNEDRSKALTVGYAAHLTKPIEPAALVTTVASVAASV